MRTSGSMELLGLTHSTLKYAVLGLSSTDVVVGYWMRPSLKMVPFGAFGTRSSRNKPALVLFERILSPLRYRPVRMKGHTPALDRATSFARAICPKESSASPL